MKTKAILIGAVALISMAFISAGNWVVDAAKANVGFSITGPFGKVKGTFTGLKTTIVFDENNLKQAKISASVDVSTIETGIGLRNKDLRDKEEWFNGSKYPQITIQSKEIQKTANGYKLLGDLTMKGVTKPVEIPFTFAPAGKGGLFKAEFHINRADFGVGKSGGSVSNDVTINLEVPVNQ